MVAFHDKVASTGFRPAQTLPQMMCEEFYGCNKELEVASKPKKGKKKSSKAKSKTKPVERGDGTSEL